MNKFVVITYGIITVICAWASFVVFTDNIDQYIVSAALGAGTGTHFVLFLKGLLYDL